MTTDVGDLLVRIALQAVWLAMCVQFVGFRSLPGAGFVSTCVLLAKCEAPVFGSLKVRVIIDALFTLTLALLLAQGIFLLNNQHF